MLAMVIRKPIKLMVPRVQSVPRATTRRGSRMDLLDLKLRYNTVRMTRIPIMRSLGTSFTR